MSQIDEAIIVFSRQGLYQKTIKASKILSDKHAQQLWPLVSQGSLLSLNKYELVLYRKNYHGDSYFSPASIGEGLYKNKNITDLFEAMECVRFKTNIEVEKYHVAKKLISEELSRRLNNKISAIWEVLYLRYSDFPFKGNLLLGATKITTNFPIKTPFASFYNLDIAVLGDNFNMKTMPLAAIEIDCGFNPDIRRNLIEKSAYFPIIYIDVSKTDISSMNNDWATRVIDRLEHIRHKTLVSKIIDSDKHSITRLYVYLPTLLYPLYTQFPDLGCGELRQQFLVFVDDKGLEKFKRWRNTLAQKLKIPKERITTGIVTNKNEQTQKIFAQETDIVGSGWQQVNEHSFMRLTLDCPKGLDDLKSLVLYQTVVCSLLMLDALVGYKYANGVGNSDPDSDIWTYHEPCDDNGEYHHKKYYVLPKRLAEPLSLVLDVITQLSQK